MGEGSEESILNNDGAQQIRSHFRNKGKFKLESSSETHSYSNRSRARSKWVFYPVQLWISRLCSRTIGRCAILAVLHVTSKYFRSWFIVALSFNTNETCRRRLMLHCETLRETKERKKENAFRSLVTFKVQFLPIQRACAANATHENLGKSPLELEGINFLCSCRRGVWIIVAYCYFCLKVACKIFIFKKS